MMRKNLPPTRWMRITLVLAGLYNLLWGGLVVAFPTLWFEFLDLSAPLYPAIWQCVGMVVGVYGIGYLIAPPIRTVTGQLFWSVCWASCSDPSVFSLRPRPVSSRGPWGSPS